MLPALIREFAPSRDDRWEAHLKSLEAPPGVTAGRAVAGVGGPGFGVAFAPAPCPLQAHPACAGVGRGRRTSACGAVVAAQLVARSVAPGWAGRNRPVAQSRILCSDQRFFRRPCLE